MSVDLRPYQQQLMDDVRNSMRPYKVGMKDGSIKDAKGFKRIAVYSPQGSGKSVMIAFNAIESAKKGNKVLILTHRQEIFKQNISAIEKSDEVKVQPISAITKHIDFNCQCYCGMTMTIIRRVRTHPEWQEWIKSINVLIVDELHRGEHDPVMQYISPNIFIIGYSASILRYGNGCNQLYKFYDIIVKGVTPDVLIKLGYLVPARYYTFDAPNLDSVTINPSSGDYTQMLLQNKFANKERYGGVVKNYIKLIYGLKTLVFTTGRIHAVELCEEFNKQGVRAKYLLSKSMPKTDSIYSGERNEIIRQFDNGEFEVLVNIEMLDTGFNAPSIEAIILDFSTISYTKYSQVVGRGSRPNGVIKKHFHVLDFGGNYERFGKYESPTPRMSLFHGTTDGGEPKMKECPIEDGGCRRFVHANLKTCPYCGYIFKTKREIYEVELSEVVEQNRILGIKEESLSLEDWCRLKADAKWALPRIFIHVMIKYANMGQRKAFEAARKVLRTKDGGEISPLYYNVVKRIIDKDYRKKNPTNILN